MVGSAGSCKKEVAIDKNSKVGEKKWEVEEG